jgi:hypothetical protein
MYHGPCVIDEPCLLDTAISWANASAQSRLVTAAAPEMGNKLRHKKFGGKLTICVLCYGDYYEMHHHCLDSIMRTIPLDKLDLRVAANCVGQASLNYLRTLPVTKMYMYRKNKGKYAIMRDMFWDKHNPITTKYIVWFDDNCYVQHNNWVNLLAADALVQPANVGMYGLKMYYAFDPEEPNPRPWFERQIWYKDKPMRNRRGAPDINGLCVHFCADWWFAMPTDVMRECDIPSLGLIQRGGDMVIGEQLYQNDYAIKSFNTGKALIYQPPYKELPNRKDKIHVLPWQAETL